MKMLDICYLKKILILLLPVLLINTTNATESKSDEMYEQVLTNEMISYHENRIDKAVNEIYLKLEEKKLKMLENQLRDEVQQTMVNIAIEDSAAEKEKYFLEMLKKIENRPNYEKILEEITNSGEVDKIYYEKSKKWIKLKKHFMEEKNLSKNLWENIVAYLGKPHSVLLYEKEGISYLTKTRRNLRDQHYFRNPVLQVLKMRLCAYFYLFGNHKMFKYISVELGKRLSDTQTVENPQTVYIDTRGKSNIVDFFSQCDIYEKADEMELFFREATEFIKHKCDVVDFVMIKKCTRSSTEIECKMTKPWLEIKNKK